MPYGTLKVDTITYTSGGADASTTISGLVQGGFPNITITGTISGATITGNTGNFTTLTAVTGIFTTVLSGTTTTGVTANFQSGVFTTQVSGTIVAGPTHTGTTANFVSGVFTTRVSGLTVTGDAGQFTTLTAITGIFTSGTFSSGLKASGVIESTTGGIKFPDATIQTTAATATANAATTTGIQTFTAAQRGAVVVQAYSTGIALNFSSGNNFQITLTGNTTLQTPTNIASGQAGVVTIIQGTASNTMAFSTGWLYPGGSGSTPSLTATSGAVDLLVYYTKDASSVSYRLVQDVKA
jgi:hypothetical protein